MKITKEQVKKYFLRNIVVFIWAIFSLVLELYAIVCVDGKPYLSSPIYPILFFGTILALLLLCRTKYAKMIISCLAFAFQGVANILCVFLYDSNGTTFEWSMIDQRFDATATIESFDFNFTLAILFIVLQVALIFACVICSSFCYKKGETFYKNSKLTRIITSICLVICATFTVFMPAISVAANKNKSYVDIYLYGDGYDKYQQKGITSNLFYEFFSGTLADKFKEFDTEGIEEFIDEGGYLDTSSYHGISKGNNLVYILVESFDWFALLNHMTEQQSRILYPNLNKLLDQSLLADNYHAREKTDLSELISLVGNTTASGFINYNFQNNEYPYSLPNLFRQGVIDNGNQVKQIASFHQNDGGFYNRDQSHIGIGFDEYIAIEQMQEYGLVNTWNEDKSDGERTLDSKTIEVMQNKMFPKTDINEQYMTYWITFAMHGRYYERSSLSEQGYYEKIDELGVFPSGQTDKEKELRGFAATVMDFDKAVGLMMNKLEKNGQLDNTTVVMYADHNAYYYDLSKYAKNIESQFNPELYRIPYIIYDTKLYDQYVNNNGTNKISKFTSVYDSLPTILDIFGIKGYKNLYYGTSMLIEEVESIIFSRSYLIFFNDKMMFYSINNILWTSEDYTKRDKDQFIEKAKVFLIKLEYIEKIYHTNYFKNNSY